jgi:ABC-type lipoprotein export system ATPase subunit
LLEEPSEGEYRFEDQPVQKLSEKRRTELHRTQIGFVFQAYHLIDELTVYENIETPLLYKGVAGSARKSRVAELLDRFNIVAKKDLFPSQLSGGQQQLVGIARALAAEPSVIFADEPRAICTPTSPRHYGAFSRAKPKRRRHPGAGNHSELNAEYGSRVVRLKDGWLEPATAVCKESVSLIMAAGMYRCLRLSESTECH